MHTFAYEEQDTGQSPVLCLLKLNIQKIEATIDHIANGEGGIS
jgi:hypothetical protein